MSEQKTNNITIADVAEALGISKTTVSRAISGKGRIGEDTRQKVLDYIEKHHYKPNMIAKGLAQSRTYNICVVMPSDYVLEDLQYFNEALIGIQEVAAIMEYDILLSIARHEDTTALKQILENHKVDGAILLRTFCQDPHVEMMLQSELPFVTTGTSEYPGVVQVDYDHEGACCELTSILLTRDYKRIALLGGHDSIMVNRMREAGYRRAFAQMGKELDESLMFQNLENKLQIDMAVGQVMAACADCIVCMDDGICSHVLHKLQEERVKVPEDVKVASFYNSLFLENHIPSITSLEFSGMEMGIRACRNLLAQIEGEEVEQRVLLPYKVVLKDSTK